MCCVRPDQGSPWLQATDGAPMLGDVDGCLIGLRTAGLHLQRHFSSSVSWTTSGTLKAVWSHLVNMKGIRWPRCSASEEGPCGAAANLQSMGAAPWTMTQSMHTVV